MIERLQVKLNSIEVSCLTKSADKPKVTVVFIHGFPFHSGIWAAQLAALPGDVQGIAYDIRGFGNSTTDHPFYSVDLFARDLLELADTLPPAKLVLCGISMGGYIALRAVEIAADKIAGLVLCDTNASADSNEGKLKRFASIDQVMSGGIKDFADNFIKNLFSERTFSSNPTVTDFIRGIIVNTPGPVICSTQLALASRTDLTALLPSIKVPVLVIRGAEDRLMTEEQVKILSTQIQNAGFQEIADAGHLPNCEAPEQFNQVLNAYLSKHFLS